MDVEARLARLGYGLPSVGWLYMDQRPCVPVRILGNQAYVAAVGPLNPDGSPSGPFGKLGTDVSLEQGRKAAMTALMTLLSLLKQELGDLGKVANWLTFLGLANVADNFSESAHIFDGFSELLLELYGADVGRHALSVICVSSLPHNYPVMIEARLEISSAG